MNKMIIVYILLGIAGITAIIYIAGLCLPKERVITRKGNFGVPPEVLYEIVTDNRDWQYRSNLKDLTVLEEKEGVEVWEETGNNGAVIRFGTKEKRPYSFYSFDMKSRLFHGYWTGEFEADGKGDAVFTATEFITVKNPFIRTIAYLFFNIGKMMDGYQQDLQKIAG